MRTAAQHRKRILWKVVTLRNYVETGMSQLRFANYFLLVFGIGEAVKTGYMRALVIGGSYFCLCLAIGFLWDHLEGYSTDFEWRQSRSPFAREVRGALGTEGEKGDVK